MSKPVNDFNYAHAPFMMSLEQMKDEWEERAIRINAGERPDGIEREAKPFFSVELFREDDDVDDQPALSLVVEDRAEKASNKNHLIMMLYIFEAQNGTDYELFLNLDPYGRVRTNDDPADGTLNSMKVFPKTKAGVTAMFNECEEKIILAKNEGHDFPHKENQRMKAGGSGPNEPNPNS